MPRLLDAVRAALRVRHYSWRTEKAYVGWVVRFVRHCGMRHPRECGEGDARSFLELLAVQRGVSASTQNQARAALMFLYRDVLAAPLSGGSNMVPAKTRVRVPNVLEKSGVEAVLGHLDGAPRLVVMLLYGAGLRLNEALNLRLKDIDAGRRTVVVRAGKGNKDRRSVLPKSLIGPITEQMQRVQTSHLAAMARGRGYTALPPALARKMPNAVRDWRWSWLFPAARDAYDPEERRNVRYPMHATTVQRAIAMAGHVPVGGLASRAHSTSCPATPSLPPDARRSIVFIPTEHARLSDKNAKAGPS